MSVADEGEYHSHDEDQQAKIAEERRVEPVAESRRRGSKKISERRKARSTKLTSHEQIVAAKRQISSHSRASSSGGSAVADKYLDMRVKTASRTVSKRAKLASAEPAYAEEVKETQPNRRVVPAVMRVLTQSRSPSLPTTRETARDYRQRRTSVSSSGSSDGAPPPPATSRMKLPKRVISRSRSYSRSTSPPRPPTPSQQRRPQCAVGPSDRENPLPSKCLGIFGLNSYTQGVDLQRVIERTARCEQVIVVHDRQTQRSRGFAFAHFRTTEDAARVRAALNCMELDKKLLRCDYSLTERPHSPTPGMYMGHRDRFAYRPAIQQQQSNRFRNYPPRGGHKRDSSNYYNSDYGRPSNNSYRDDRQRSRYGPPEFKTENGTMRSRPSGMRERRSSFGFRR